VCMVRRGDDESVEVVSLLIEHLAEVVVAFCIRIAFKDFGREVVVEVAQGDDVFGPAVSEVALAHSADTHSGDPELVTWGLMAGAAEDKTGHDDGCGKTGSEEGAPGHSAACLVAGILKLIGADCFVRWHFTGLLFDSDKKV